MKKDLVRLCELTIFLFLISVLVITLTGNTYTIKYDNKDIKIAEIEKTTGDIEILEEKVVNDKYILKIKGTKKGKVYIYFNQGDFNQGEYIYIHNYNVITINNYFGKSTCSEIIPISLSIVLVYSLYILIKRYKNHKKENLYQYRNIAYLGIIIFLSLFTIYNILSIINYRGLFQTINVIIGSMSFVSFIMFPLALITFILVTLSNISLIRKEGLSLRNILGLLLGIFIIVATRLPDFVYGRLMLSQKINIYNLNGPGPYIYDFIESLVYLTITYLECILIATIIIATKAVKKKIAYNKDYIIILGCQIKKDGSLTPLLKGRVDKAIEFRNKQLEATGKDLIFIPSGGKGPDEVISEAEAIKNYLIEQGIDKKNILVDDKSTNTYENIKFSNNLVKKKNANIAYSTTNYHVLRAGLIATEQGLLLEGIGSKTKAYFWINAFIREFIGTLYSERKKHITVFILLTIIILIMVIITFFANNI